MSLRVSHNALVGTLRGQARSLVQTCYYSAQAVKSRRKPSATKEGPQTSDDTRVDTSNTQNFNGDASIPSTSGASLTSEKPKPSKSTQGPPSRRLNKIESYLASLSHSSHNPTLDDLSKYRPAKPVQISSRDYPQIYNMTWAAVDRSFTRPQMMDLARELGIIRDHGRPTKKKLVTLVMAKSWDMPHPLDVEKKKKEMTKVDEKKFKVSASQCFLLLGKDGSNLLQLSSEFKVQVSLDPSPLILRVRGQKRHLDAFSERFQELQKGISSEVFRSGSEQGVRPDLVQTISRLSGAFIENIGSGEIRITSNNSQCLIHARRLCECAINQESLSRCTPLITQLSSTSDMISSSAGFPPSQYAMYPYMTPNELSWTSGGMGGFRARKVGEWLAQREEDSLRSIGAASLKALSLENEAVDLRSSLTQGLPSLHSDEKGVVTVSLGHVLITPTASQASRPSLVPPLPNSWPIETFTNWLAAGSGRRTFKSSVPTPLLSSFSGGQHTLHRLVYRSIPDKDLESAANSTSQASPTRYLRFEVDIPEDSPEGSPPPSVSDVLADSPSSPELEGSEANDSAIQNITTGVEKASLNLNCSQSGVEVSIDVAQPDRSTDLRLSASHFRSLSNTSSPAEVQKYVSELSEYLLGNPQSAVQPDPPNSVVFDGVHYTLESSLNINRSLVPLRMEGDLPQVTKELTAIIESILDLESNQKYSTCQIEYTDMAGDAERWDLFLADCERLSSGRYSFT